MNSREFVWAYEQAARKSGRTNRLIKEALDLAKEGERVLLIVVTVDDMERLRKLIPQDSGVIAIVPFSSVIQRDLSGFSYVLIDPSCLCFVMTKHLDEIAKVIESLPESQSRDVILCNKEQLKERLGVESR